MNVMTIEDPIEYHLPGISQIQVNEKKGLTFASGLRSLLRQDPDIMMVGEVRDVETARIAIQAAQTGHLVFSTIHTNDAPTVATRLLDIGIEPYLVASSVIVVHRPAPRAPDLHGLPGDVRPRRAATCFKLKQLRASTPTRCPTGSSTRGRGCGSCFGSGYHGPDGHLRDPRRSTTCVRELIVERSSASEIKREALDARLPHPAHGRRHEGAAPTSPRSTRCCA